MLEAAEPSDNTPQWLIDCVGAGHFLISCHPERLFIAGGRLIRMYAASGGLEPRIFDVFEPVCAPAEDVAAIYSTALSCELMKDVVYHRIDSELTERLPELIFNARWCMKIGTFYMALCMDGAVPLFARVRPRMSNVVVVLYNVAGRTFSCVAYNWSSIHFAQICRTVAHAPFIAPPAAPPHEPKN